MCFWKYVYWPSHQKYSELAFQYMFSFNVKALDKINQIDIPVFEKICVLNFSIRNHAIHR